MVITEIQDFLTPIAVLAMGLLTYFLAKRDMVNTLQSKLADPEFTQGVLVGFGKPIVDYAFAKVTGSLGGEISGISRGIQAGAVAELGPLGKVAGNFLGKGNKGILGMLAPYILQYLQSQNQAPSGDGGSMRNPWEK